MSHLKKSMNVGSMNINSNVVSLWQKIQFPILKWLVWFSFPCVFSTSVWYIPCQSSVVRVFSLDLFLCIRIISRIRWRSTAVHRTCCFSLTCCFSVLTATILSFLSFFSCSAAIFAKSSPAPSPWAVFQGFFLTLGSRLLSTGSWH